MICSSTAIRTSDSNVFVQEGGNDPLPTSMVRLGHNLGSVRSGERKREGVGETTRHRLMRADRPWIEAAA